MDQLFRPQVLFPLVFVLQVLSVLAMLAPMAGLVVLGAVIKQSLFGSRSPSHPFAATPENETERNARQFADAVTRTDAISMAPSPGAHPIHSFASGIQVIDMMT